MPSALLFLLLAAGLAQADAPREAVAERSQEVARQIDEHLARHWEAAGVQPAPPCDDATFLRRVTLDLTGRTPTHAEATAFAADAASDKRLAAIRRLMSGPEYRLHLANLLEDVIQGRLAGDRETIAWLRASLEEGRAWDDIFRQAMVGPWDTQERQWAARFLQRRINSVDDLTNDTARAFFGVDISCAKCHDHPLVGDWTQHHYYGLASFFSRTQQGRDNKPPVDERETGEVSFIDTAGGQHQARFMFLSGALVEDPRVGLDPRLVERRQAAAEAGGYLPATFSPREELVRTALEERQFVSRSIANRLWAFLLGRGLVHPVDQMHSENPSSVPGLLECLAEGLAAHEYNLDGLMAGIVASQVYQRASRWESLAEPPPPEHFAGAAVRPLTPVQYGLSVMLASGDGSYDTAMPPDALRQRYLGYEGGAYQLVEMLDRRRDDYQSSTTEALFMSNAEVVQQAAAPNGGNLAGRLSQLGTTDEILNTAFWTVLSRPPADDERSELAAYLDEAPAERAARCGHLVWALLTSAEFRFNH